MLNPKSFRDPHSAFRISFNKECATPFSRAGGDDGCRDSGGDRGSVQHGDGRGSAVHRADRLAGARAGDARRASGNAHASLVRGGVRVDVVLGQMEPYANQHEAARSPEKQRRLLV